MDDAKQTIGGELPLQGPHYPRSLNHEQPSTTFIPLKLVLQPSGPVVELTRPDMIMGRHSQADVRLPLPDVSRRHCRFVFTNGAWQVFDLDSLNGVFVNGKRVAHATLCDHDSLAIGGFRFVVDLSGGAADADHSASPEEIIHRIADALPRKTPDIDPQRKAS
jgi:pSer/pThr/pTyr-binding forkhead associated (FHA) protein